MRATLASSSRPGATLFKACAEAASHGANHSVAIPFGITIGSTPHCHIACFMKRLTVVIVPAAASARHGTRSKPKVWLAFQKQCTHRDHPRAATRRAMSTRHQLVCHSSPMMVTGVPAATQRASR